MSNYSIKADLLKLKGSFLTNLKGKTATKRCLVIPIDDSNLFVGEKGVYLNLTAIEMREERYGDTHVLKQSLPKDVYQAMTDEERNAQPNLDMLIKIAQVLDVDIKDLIRFEAASQAK